jgi:condensation domain-containing protein
MVADHEVRARPVLPVSDRLLIAFKGRDSGADELSWGQQELWRAMRRRNVWIPLASVVALPAGTTVEDVAAKLRFMMGRYPTLRTRLRFDPDRTRQVLAEEGMVPLDIVDAPADVDPRWAAHRFCVQYMDRDYDFVQEWPVRMAVLRHGGVPAYQILVLCHLVLDGEGAAVMASELAGWDPKAGSGIPAPSPMSPLEQARRQRLPAARRQSEAALRHWEGILRAASRRRSGNLNHQVRPRYWKGQLNSPATHRAVRMIAARTRVDTSAVLLALYAVALARITGMNPVPVQLMVSNRFRPEFAGTVSPVAQHGLSMIDVADMTIDAVAVETGRRALATHKHAYYDPRRLDELISRINQERGDEVELGFFFNDRRFRSRSREQGASHGGSTASAQVCTVLPRSNFEWIMTEDVEFTEPVHLFVEDVDDDPDTLGLTVSADTRCLPPQCMEALTRAIEQIAVDAATHPATPTLVSDIR